MLKATKTVQKTNNEIVAEAEAAGLIARPISTERDAVFYFAEASALAESLGFDATDGDATINRVRSVDAKAKLCAALFSLHLAVSYPHLPKPTAEGIARDLMLFDGEITPEQWAGSDFAGLEIESDSLKLLTKHFAEAEKRERLALEASV